MCRPVSLVLIAFVFLGGCVGSTQEEESAPSTPSIAAATTTSSTVPTTAVTTTAPTTATSNTESVLLPTTTLADFVEGVAEIDFRDDVAFSSQHQKATWAPVTGWVSTETPIPMSVLLRNQDHGEQLVRIGYATAIANAEFSWTGQATGMVDLEPGINEVPVIVAGISPPLSISVPVTYLPGGTVQLATVVEADEGTITLDYGYYYWDGSFPSIGDHDPGVLETVPVAPNAHVILDEELIGEYSWFVEQRQNSTSHDEFRWNPTSEYEYYWATIHQGQLVELWRVPFG